MMRIAIYMICISIANYLIITMIVDIYLMGMVCFSYAPKVWEKRIILSKKNRIDIQTQHQCSTYEAAYILGNYGITTVGGRTLSNYSGENEKRICVSKRTKKLIKELWL